ncbi:MAG: pirin family protein [Burkholderiales bacterium]|nr:pirin family protein [Burkholderiales bacterium]
MSAIVSVDALGAPPWKTIDPFLFCVYHDDAYPAADAQMRPRASLAGRAIGQDFSRKDGWSMYHGRQVPGFPSHPHRGFETVTIVRTGLIDHSDSLGAAARFGQGDVQWLTAGRGIVHAEMFPLLSEERANPLELFQIWLNLPARSKMAPPHFTMLWGPDIPRLEARDGALTTVDVIAGRLPGVVAPPAPPPDSWASQAEGDVAIWTLRMQPGARWSLPAAAGQGTRRMLYWFAGNQVTIDGRKFAQHAAIELSGSAEIAIANGDAASEFLLLQGRPIAEPVAQYGPFVMNTREEIMQTMADYQRTGFGGWPWDADDPVHGRDPRRFARHPDGREERPRETAPA